MQVRKGWGRNSANEVVLFCVVHREGQHCLQYFNIFAPSPVPPVFLASHPAEDKVTKKEDKKEETKAEKKDASKQGKEAKDAQKPQQEWVQTQDPYGRLCWWESEVLLLCIIVQWL